MSRSAPFLLCTLMLATPGSSSAQPISVGLDAIGAADLLYSAGDAEGAYDALMERLHAGAADYEVLWRAARAGVAVGVQRQGSEAQNQYLDPAIVFAERALELRPDGRFARYWRGAASGRRAMNAGPRYSTELAQVVYQDGHALLTADSLDAGAHNMLGKLFYEVMILSRIERLLARVFLSSDALTESSWEDAERYLARAAELEPESVLYRYDWGAFLLRRNRVDAAVEELQAVVALPVLTPVDPMLQEEAKRLLESATDR